MIHATGKISTAGMEPTLEALRGHTGTPFISIIGRILHFLAFDSAYDLQDKAKSQFYELDEDSEEYVMREVISRIFASIGVPHFRLTQKYCVFNIGAS